MKTSEKSPIAYFETSEQKRLNDAREKGIPWKKWGPYLSERQWGTVREDYSKDGNAWNYFSHDQSRSRAYRWGEDGLAGISDERQQLCFAIAVWNGRDPILKERLFGLTNNEGNHGEDVKEYYFYLDSTPTHSYMKYLYKYPQKEYPYLDLVETNRRRSKEEFEYELLDTGIFDDDRYFDVFVEYAKADPEDVLIRISVHNRGPEAAEIHLLPTLWFRNTWGRGHANKPALRSVEGGKVLAVHDDLGERTLQCEGNPELLFTENESNTKRLWGQENQSRYVKDAFHEFVISGKKEAVNPSKEGTKAAAHYRLEVPAGGSKTVRLRLSKTPVADPFGTFEKSFTARKSEADEFYDRITSSALSEDERRIHRQALAGMLWSKQFYYFDVDRWLDEHEAHPLLGNAHRGTRNTEWFHMLNKDVISMPDKWEYPWYAAWDLAFHAMAFSTVDVDFAKQQLELMLQPFYLHPSGQIPAYEWNFSDVNPPVHAWATIFLYRTQQALHGEGDLEFLRRSFGKLMMNFTWWVNRKDRFGKNVFEGGFLGLDNIGVFDRSSPLPGGGHLEQADGTAWMALFCQNMGEIATELAAYDESYSEMAAKFVDHFLWIAHAVNQTSGMWDEEDGFYYDVLRMPDGSATRLKVRSLVGLLPMCATTVIEAWQREQVPRAVETMTARLKRMPNLLASIHATGPGHFGVAGRGISALVNEERLRRILTKMLDENEFLSPHGIRSISRFHAQHPYTFLAEGREYRVDYNPAESDNGLFGGNSNWRGPVWMPMNALILRALMSFYMYYGDNFKIECPTGSGKLMNLFEVAHEIANRLIGIFLRDSSGRRPVYGGTEKFQTDPHWKDHLLFYEYFHGDNGAGLGASHQTGWTGLVANFIDIFGRIDAAQLLAAGKRGAFTRDEKTREERVHLAPISHDS